MNAGGHSVVQCVAVCCNVSQCIAVLLSHMKAAQLPCAYRERKRGESEKE